MRVKIVGAGSVGNHHAQACRAMGWDVTVVDTSLDSLERMRQEIYPKRYGEWDNEIKLRHDYPDGKDVPRGDFDIIMIDTPPDVRLRLATDALKEKPRLLHLEKPLCTPSLDGLDYFLYEWKKELKDCKVTVGYNHAVSSSINVITQLLESEGIGEVLTIDVEFREHWKGIFDAHPWIAGPEDSYLGYWKRGGGAGGEHSHALHLFLYLAHICGWVLPNTAYPVSSQLALAGNYDQLIAFLINYVDKETSKDKVGRVVQDVVTYPVRKWARIQGTKGAVEWHCNGHKDGDVISFYFDSLPGAKEMIISKTRKKDFLWLMQHYDDLLSGVIDYKDSPLHIDYGVKVMNILHDAYYG